MKKVFYLLFSAIAVFGFISCEEDAEYTIADPIADTFEITSPTTGASLILNETNKDNTALTVTWNDGTTGASSYTVEIATDENFTTPVSLGEATAKLFTMSVAEINTALLNAGIGAYNNTTIYLRVSAGSTATTPISLTVASFASNPPKITSPANGFAVTLTKDTADEIITFAWKDTDFEGTSTVSVSYDIEVALADTNFAEAQKIATTSELSYERTHLQLNGLAISLGIAPDETGSIDVRIKATSETASGVLERVSEPVTITVTAYASILDLSTTWGVVGSAANNWGATPDLPFFKTNVNGVLAAYVTLTDGEIKFRENSDWTNNYGDDGADGTLEAGGSNIAVTAGSYKIVMNLNDLTYTMESFSLGVVGGATPNGWNGPDLELTYDQYSDVFRGIVTLTEGEIKFRMNNDWAVNYGDDGADGTLEQGSANIAVSAGSYIVTVNLNENTYTLTPINNIWGLVGSATTNSWDGPDMTMTRDWSQPFDDIWIIKNATLTAGEFKFRANNDWGVNYGDDGADGSLEAGGANIATTAGTFTITLNLSDPANPTYTKE